MAWYRRTALGNLLFGTGLMATVAISGCQNDVTSTTSLGSGRDDDGSATSGSGGDDVATSGAMPTTGASLDGDTGTSDATDDGPSDDSDTTGGDGGVQGDPCTVTQSGLCEDLDVSTYCYSAAPETCGIGECHDGVQACVPGIDLDLGEWAPCEGEVTPAVELCDNLDNDCDGDVDEAQGSTQCGLGICQHAEDNCIDGKPNTCNPMAGADPSETCDGLDNDCDGDIDEDFGLQVMCGVGQCTHSVGSCIDGVVPECDPFEGAFAEACDGVDNDCDGTTDEDLGSLNCGLGQCNHFEPSCVAGVQQVCDPFFGMSPEICDGLDNDCDGSADEGFGQVSCGVGICQHVVEQCVGGMLQMCDPFLGAVAEVCDDGIDNDCDGMTDESCGCGNGMVNLGEACDGAALNGQTCAGLGYDRGTLSCTAACNYDVSHCVACGDGVIGGTEQCDSTNLGGNTCVSLGFAGGSLSCDAGCNLDDSNCSLCGNGVVNNGEECDGGNFAGSTCVSLGHSAGSLTCNADCTIDETTCTDCGDGMIEGAETCDGANLGGQTCQTLGGDSGVLTCGPNCQLDVSDCTDCGDGVVEGPELCDGADLDGVTCVDFGFDGGTLICSSQCLFNTLDCTTCGDGVLEGPSEECEGGNLGGATCGSLGFVGGALSCDGNCQYDESACLTCGDGVANGTDQCDGADLGGGSCLGLGYDLGTLGCNADCTYDDTGCIECTPAERELVLGTGPTAAPGDCDPTVATLTCSSIITGELHTGLGTLSNYTCGSIPNLTQSGQDDTYEFQCQANGQVDLLLTDLLCDLDIYILSDQCSPSGPSCLTGATLAGTADDVISFNCVAGQTYYIVVEGWAFGAGVCAEGNGTYTLSFATGAVTSGCQEDCDDGVDNDGDGDTDCADSDCTGDPVCVCFGIP